MSAQRYMLTINYTDGTQMRYPVAVAYLVGRIIRGQNRPVASYQYGDGELVPVAGAN